MEVAFVAQDKQRGQVVALLEEPGLQDPGLDCALERSSGWQGRVSHSLAGGTILVQKTSYVVTADVLLPDTRGVVTSTSIHVLIRY